MSKPHHGLVVAALLAAGAGGAIRHGGGSLWVSGKRIHRIAPPQ